MNRRKVYQVEITILFIYFIQLVFTPNTANASTVKYNGVGTEVPYQLNCGLLWGNDLIYVTDIFTVNGCGGNDSIYADEYGNSIYGDSGNDTIYSFEGADTVSAGPGDDRVYAGSGDDLISGGSGEDRLFGGSGKDQVFGDAGNDNIHGGSGNDFIQGGIDQDVLHGGPGADIFVFSSGDGNDKILDFNCDLEGDRILLDSVYLVPDDPDVTIDQRGADIVISGTNDSITAKNANLIDWINCAKDYVMPLTNDDDVISGSNGTDLLKGLKGDDEISGRAGNDKLYGNSGKDKLRGGNGNDRLFGGPGDDFLYGGKGDDILRGDTGRDKMFGGPGADRFKFNSIDDSTVAKPDQIKDFEKSIDKIDLKNVDAIASTSSDDSFSLSDTREVGTLFLRSSNGNVFVEGHIDNDSIADFIIRVDKIETLTAEDFLL